VIELLPTSALLDSWTGSSDTAPVKSLDEVTPAANSLDEVIAEAEPCVGPVALKIDLVLSTLKPKFATFP